MAEQIRVQYIIEESLPEGDFRDAMYFTFKEWGRLEGTKELAQMRQARIDKWLAAQELMSTQEYNPIEE